MNRFYLTVSIRAGRVCEYCRAPEIYSNFAFEVEHIIPPSHGGLTEPENLALSCRSCNVFKASHLTGIDENGEEMATLFNPRTHAWQEHFVLNQDTYELEAMSTIGRGTINRLRLNSNKQNEARLQWKRAEMSKG